MRDEVPGTTEITHAIEQYRYQRADYHLDRYLGGVVTLQTAQQEFKEELAEDA